MPISAAGSRISAARLADARSDYIGARGRMDELVGSQES